MNYPYQPEPQPETGSTGAATEQPVEPTQAAPTPADTTATPSTQQQPAQAAPAVSSELAPTPIAAPSPDSKPTWGDPITIDPSANAGTIPPKGSGTPIVGATPNPTAGPIVAPNKAIPATIRAANNVIATCGQVGIKLADHLDADIITRLGDPPEAAALNDDQLAALLEHLTNALLSR